MNHPNLAHIYEIGVSDGVNFIAMEFVDGQTLRELIHGGRNDLGKLLRYVFAHHQYAWLLAMAGMAASRKHI